MLLHSTTNIVLMIVCTMIFAALGHRNKLHPRTDAQDARKVLLPSWYPWFAAVLLAVETVVVVSWLTGWGFEEIPVVLRITLLVLAPVFIPLGAYMLWIYPRYFLTIGPESLDTVSLRGTRLHIEYADIVDVHWITRQAGQAVRIVDRHGHKTRISTANYDVTPIEHWLDVAQRLGRRPTREELGVSGAQGWQPPRG